MADEQPELSNLAEQEEGEVAGILSALHELASRVTTPVVRACLEQAAEDIAHLTGCGGEDRQEEVSQAAG
jgi:hypothetical protein